MDRGLHFPTRYRDVNGVPDELVVTKDELAPGHVAALRTLHHHLVLDHPLWGARLEGSYIPLPDLRRYDPARARHPHVFEGEFRIGEFRIEQHDVHWVIERYVWRAHGVVLVGPPPRQLIDPVHPDELWRAVCAHLHSWWVPIADNPRRLYDATYRVYAVLTMCRVL